MKSTSTTVLFVPQTPFGKLAEMIRQAETELSRICGDNVKVVERAGKSLEHTLVKSRPWRATHCGRVQCLTCQDDKKVGQCTKRNLTYETSCQSCKLGGKEAIYIGETARSTYERGVEHLLDYKSAKPESHMSCHADEAHQGEDKPAFGMRILRQHKSPLYRQVHEAILISMNEHVVLNAKQEYNRCLLPRLSVMIGENEDKKDSEDNNVVLTNNDEDDLEENNKRKYTQRTESNPIRSKRRKLANTMKTQEKLQENTKRKRKHQENNQETPSKKLRTREFEYVAPVTHGGPRENDQPTKDQFKLNLKKHYNRNSPASNQLSNLSAKSKQGLTAKNLINFFENLKASNHKENIETPFSQQQPQPQAKSFQKLCPESLF